MTLPHRQTVSVVIPAWNAAGFISRAITSALAGQEGPLPGGGSLHLAEVIVVDDRSADRTWTSLQELAAGEPRLKILQNARNLGPGGTRNAGIAAATGDWIAVLDADDAYVHGRLPRLIATALAQDFAIIADLPLLYDLAADATAPTQLPTSGGIRRLSRADLLRPDPETGLDLGLLKPVFRRHLAESGAWRYPEELRHAEDFALYFDLIGRGEAFGLLQEAHYIFSSRIGEISGSYSPGSVTSVDYRAIAAHAGELARQVAKKPAADPEILALLEDRGRRALRQNRVYGWTLLRKREHRRLKSWLLRDIRNMRDMARMIVAKLAGHQGLPD